MLLSQLLLQRVELLQHSRLPQLGGRLNGPPVRRLLTSTRLHRAGNDSDNGLDNDFRQ